MHTPYSVQNIMSLVYKINIFDIYKGKNIEYQCKWFIKCPDKAEQNISTYIRCHSNRKVEHFFEAE